MTATAIAPPPATESRLSEIRDGLPNLCGWEAETNRVATAGKPVYLPVTNLKLANLRSTFANALHMHQPTVPAGPGGALISNLEAMFNNPGEGDNHNASVFAWCYGRIGEFIPNLVAEGCNPRIMLDYSGNLLWGLRQMGRNDVLDPLYRITTDPAYWPHVEWLGTMWSHAVAPSTPIPDLKLHIQAWQQHFAALFGWEALARVRGFSPPEMHLPNHPDTLYEYVKALTDCGYQWLLVQEHSVETLQGWGLSREQKYIPNRLVARNSKGETAEILALIKTQGSDTKLVAQMQPYFEAKSYGRQTVSGVEIPEIVAQIADGENGGVMMNEFPRDFNRIWQEIRDGDGGGFAGTTGINGTEYLELIFAAGVKREDLPVCQAIGQAKIWAKLGDSFTPAEVEAAIAELRATDHQFHVDGASWTSDRSWVDGYENVLGPMEDLSVRFHAKYDSLVALDPLTTRRPDYQRALLAVLLLETSCFRYWGQGMWTDYAQSIYDWGKAAIDS